MRVLASLLLAGIAFADPVHTGRDLVEELRPLAWLLGNWKADGDLAGMKCHEDIRYWPDLDGHVLIERAIVTDGDKNVLHEDRIVFWADRDGIHAWMIARPPVHAAELDWKETDTGFDLSPRKAGGPSLAYTRKGDDAYDYLYEERDAKGNAVKASGVAKRSSVDHPDSGYELAASLADVELGLGRFSGSDGDKAYAVKDSQNGRAVLGGEVFELRIVQKRKDGQLRMRFFAWPAGEGHDWSGRLFTNTELNGTSLSGIAKDGVLALAIPMGKPSAGMTFRWKWQDESYEWTMESKVEPGKVQKYTGKRKSR